MFPLKIEFAPSVTAPPMHHVTALQLAPFISDTTLFAAVLSAATVENRYVPAPFSTRVPVNANAPDGGVPK
jgi:hypothetical protein